MWLKWQQRDGCCVTSVTPISTLKMVYCGRRPVTGLSVSRIYLEKILVNCWRLDLRINKDGTAKMRKQRNEKTENASSTKKWRKQRKAGKVQQVIEGGSVQVGTCWAREVPTEHAQKKRSTYVYVCDTALITAATLDTASMRCRNISVLSTTTWYQVLIDTPEVHTTGFTHTGMITWFMMYEVSYLVLLWYCSDFVTGGVWHLQGRFWVEDGEALSQRRRGETNQRLHSSFVYELGQRKVLTYCSRCLAMPRSILRIWMWCVDKAVLVLDRWQWERDVAKFCFQTIQKIIHSGAQMYLYRTPGRARHVCITGRFVNTTVTGRWVGASNERAPFRFHGAVVVFVDRCCRGLGISPLRTNIWLSFSQADLGPKISPGIIIIFFFKFETFFRRLVLVASGEEIFWRLSLKFELFLATLRFHCHRS